MSDRNVPPAVTTANHGGGIVRATAMAKRRPWRRYVVLVGLGASALIGMVAVTPAALLTTIEATYRGPWFLAVLFVAYLLRPLIAGPVSVFTILVGIRYGVVPGVGIALLGTGLTCLPPYLAGRYLRTDVGVLGRVSSAGSVVVDHTGDLRGTIAGRLSPAPADSVSYGAGIAGVRPAPYVVGTILGEIPWTIGFILIGSSMERLLGNPPDRPLDLLVLATVGAILLIAAPAYRLLREYRRR